MPHFDAIKIYIAEENIVSKGEFRLLQAISPFLTRFSKLYGTYFSF